MNRIIPEYLKSIICVKGKMNNNRILSQAGAFLLFGLNTVLPESGTESIGIERLDINKEAKEKILRELDSLNINESTHFPTLKTPQNIYLANMEFNMLGITAQPT